MILHIHCNNTPHRDASNTSSAQPPTPTLW